jgi:excisionase family DNA binding protein
MSSNINIKRVCKHCETLFNAKTTTTKYCSDLCRKKANKSKEREKKIMISNIETHNTINRQIESIFNKPYLSINEASQLFGISRRTIYRMIAKNEITFAKAGSRTILKHSDFVSLFEKPKPVKSVKEKELISEFYSVKEVEEKYPIKYRRLYEIIKKEKIPTTLHFGKLQISKSHIDKYFEKKYKDITNVVEWYSVEEIQSKYNLSRDQIYGRISDYKIPKQRVGRFVKVSKEHFDKIMKVEF